jgi:hypothetical protein
MATRIQPLPLERFAFASPILFRFAIPRLFSFLTIFFSANSSASAQTATQQFLYTSGGFALSG